MNENKEMNKEAAAMIHQQALIIEEIVRKEKEKPVRWGGDPTLYKDVRIVLDDQTVQITLNELKAAASAIAGLQCAVLQLIQRDEFYSKLESKLNDLGISL